MFEYDDPNRPAVFAGSFNPQNKVSYAVGSHVYSTPEEDCHKILDWFTRYPILSDEQAVHDLKIGNFRQRIAHLRKRGFVIHGEGIVMDVTPTRLHTSMVYAQHHSIPASVTIPYIWSYNINSYAMANWIVSTFLKLSNFEVAALTDIERYALELLLKKMQRAMPL